MFNKSNEGSLQSQLLHYSFKMQKICGLFPYQKNRYMLFGLFIVFTHLISLSLVVYLMSYHLNNVEVLMSGFDGIIAHIQCLSKFLPLLLHRKQMRILIDDLLKFSRTENADDYKFWIKMSKLFIILLIISGIAYLAYPGFLFQYYIPNFSHAYTIILIMNKAQIIHAAFVLLGTDLFYLALFAIIKVQYQTLKADLELLEANENKYESLKLWINQHIFLTKYTKCFTRTFSEASLLEYVAATVNLCTELYFFGERETDGLFMTAIYIVAIFVEICLICLTADEITSRAMDLANALYFIEWYNFPHKEMKMLPLIIQQTQTPMRFVAGGLVNLDKRAMTTILQNSYTFYALARQMKQN